jgi:hypothetical protein
VLEFLPHDLARGVRRDCLLQQLDPSAPVRALNGIINCVELERAQILGFSLPAVGDRLRARR